METCAKCEGSGWCRDAILIRQEPCNACGGTGKVPVNDLPARLSGWVESGGNTERLLGLRS